MTATCNCWLTWTGHGMWELLQCYFYIYRGDWTTRTIHHRIITSTYSNAVYGTVRHRERSVQVWHRHRQPRACLIQNGGLVKCGRFIVSYRNAINRVWGLKIGWTGITSEAALVFVGNEDTCAFTLKLWSLEVHRLLGEKWFVRCRGDRW